MSASPGPDRRRAPRLAGGSHGIHTAWIRPGHPAEVIDLSPGGALVETTRRLLPGTRAELQVQTADRRFSIGGLVLRCAVCSVGPDFVRYRGAIRFERDAVTPGSRGYQLLMGGTPPVETA